MERRWYYSGMLVLEKRCKVCMAIKKNKQLMKRIYDSSWFVPHSKDDLKAIAKDFYPTFTYEGLLNHTKKHQFIDSQDYTEKMLQATDKKLEQNAVRKAVKAVDSLQSIIDIGQQRLEDGEITVDTNQLIRASQVKLNQESKQKDQELATIDMVAHFLSGAYAGDRVYIEPDQTETT